MKAAIIRRYGAPKVFQHENLPDISPRANEIKIKVMASSVNPVDFKTRSGSIFFLSSFKFPKILGSDFSGIIVECGAEVKDVRVGDEVFGFTNAVTEGGAYGEFLCIDRSRIARKPTNLSFLEAAVIPLAGSTAYQGLVTLGRIKSGMRICVIGATGGVGHFAVQIAKSMGCHVTGVCHSNNAELAQRFGCDEVVPYDRIDFRAINQFFDLIFDSAGKLGYARSRHRLELQGSFISTIPSLATVLLPRLPSRVKGRQVRHFWAHSNSVDLQFLAELCEQKLLQPYIEHHFPIAQIDLAHELSESGRVRGKIAIEVNHSAADPS
jgi:NADPH:quinone reductase-like Zn-dependent oxidoreductase